jgi:hypothetical protein
MRKRSPPGFAGSLAIALGAAWIGMACNVLSNLGRTDGSAAVDAEASSASSRASESSSSSGEGGGADAADGGGIAP